MADLSQIPEGMEPITVGIEAAAALLNLSEAHFRRNWRAMGIQGFRVGKRIVFPVRDLREWASNQLTASVA